MKVMMTMPFFQVYYVLTSVAYSDPSYHFETNPDLNPILFRSEPNVSIADTLAWMWMGLQR
jgi:hypothetical protein